LESTEFHSPTLRENIAYGNVSLKTILINDKPIIYMYADKDILKGEQLGFDYGLGYWVNLNMLPKLFDNKGRVVPIKEYSYTRMAFLISTPKIRERENSRDKCFFYTREQYKQDIQKQIPVQLCPGTKPQSFFKFRNALVNNNIIAQQHKPLSS